MLAASGVTPDAMPPEIGECETPAGDAALSSAEKLATAREILFDKAYADNVAGIMGPTGEFERALDRRTTAAVKSAESSSAFARNVLAEAAGRVRKLAAESQAAAAQIASLIGEIQTDTSVVVSAVDES